MRTASTGRSLASVRATPIRFTTFMPDEMRPKTVCFPSRKGVGANVMKNCEPFVLGPALAIERMPAPVCLSSRLISS